MFEALLAGLSMSPLFDQSVENRAAMDTLESLIFLMSVLLVLDQSIWSVEALAAFLALVLFDIEMLVHVVRHQMALHGAIGTVGTRSQFVFVRAFVKLDSSRRARSLIATWKFAAKSFVCCWPPAGSVKSPFVKRQRLSGISNERAIELVASYLLVVVR